MSQRVFICYARVDQPFALPLAEQLKARGIGVWIDKWDARPGDDWDRDIDQGLRECTHLLIVLSPASVDSREVRGELRTILDLGKPVLPVLYKPCEIPRQLRVVQFVDFTQRKPHDVSALNELLQALSPLVTDEHASPLGPAVPAPRPAPPAPARVTGGRGLTIRTKRLLQAAVALVLLAGGWYGLDVFTSDLRIIRDAALSPDGAYLATANYSSHGVVRVWEVTLGPGGAGHRH